MLMEFDTDLNPGSALCNCTQDLIYIQATVTQRSWMKPANECLSEQHPIGSLPVSVVIPLRGGPAETFA